MSNLARLSRAEGITPDDACKFLAQLAEGVPSNQNIVEIGVYKAKSVCYLAHGARKGGQFPRVYGIDPWDLPGNEPGIYGRRFDDPSIEYDAKMNVRTQGMSRYVTLIKGFSANVALRWNHGKIGLIYIDGDHRYESVRTDFTVWFPYLTDNATVVFDDYDTENFPGLVRAVDELVEEGVIEPVEVVFNRLAVTRVTAGNDSDAPVVVSPEGDSYQTVNQFVDGEPGHPTPEAATTAETVQGGNTAETHDDDPGVNSEPENEASVLSDEENIESIKKDLMKLTAVQLNERATVRGIEIPKGARKAEIAEALARYTHELDA